MKDKLIKISNQIKEIEDKYKSEISKDLSDKKTIKFVANISNSLMLARFRITDALNLIIKREQTWMTYQQ